MKEQHWVLMGNDYPAAILVGTKKQAEAAARRRNEEDERERAVQGTWRTRRIYWRVCGRKPVHLKEK